MAAESPLAEALARTLREEITRGTLPAGRPLPPERGLAEKYDVSRAIVRKAVSLLASEGWLSIQPHCRPVVVQQQAERAASSSSETPDHISVWLWPYVDDFSASTIFRGIQKSLHGSKLRLVVASASSGSWQSILRSEREFLLEAANDSSCAGSIVWLLGGEESLPAVLENQRQGHPVIFIDRKPPVGMDADFVGTDNTVAAQRVVRHLIDLGHQRIACITNMDEASTVAERQEGYEKALREADLPVRQSLIFRHEVRGNESERTALGRLASELLGSDDTPTAIFAVNDSTALQLIDLFEQRGLNVPQDLSVAGFDGLLRWIPGGGRLTTVDQDFFRMGELGAELLRERIENGQPNTFRHVLLDAPLRVQGSTAPPRADNDLFKKTIPNAELTS